jgi:SOS-response transcriptional repressor LexA
VGIEVDGNGENSNGQEENALAARLRFAIGSRSQAEAARLSGVPKSNLSKILAGTTPAFDALIKLAQGLEVDPMWLATGDGFWQPAGAELVRVTRYDIHLAAGAGGWQERAEQLDALVFSRDYLAKLGQPDGHGFIVLDVVGDSMDPTVRDGAVALIDTNDLRFSDGIWAFTLGNEMRIKRLRRGLKSLQVISDNPAYPPEEITAAEEDQLNLIGRVRWVGQTL